MRLSLRRWSIEEVFSWTKSALGWEQVQVLNFHALRTLVALAWIAASFVFDLGESKDSPQLQFLAHLGGYVPHKNRPPGKKILLLGLRRLADAYLVAYAQPKNAPPDLLDTLLFSLFLDHDFCPDPNHAPDSQAIDGAAPWTLHEGLFSCRNGGWSNVHWPGLPAFFGWDVILDGCPRPSSVSISWPPGLCSRTT